MALFPGTIDDLNFITFRHRDLAPIGMRTQELTRPGVDGYAAREIGRMPQRFSIETEGGAISNLDLTILRNAYMARQGKLVTVIEPGFDTDFTHYNVVVEEVHVGAGQPIATATDNFLWILPVLWVMRYTELTELFL